MVVDGLEGLPTNSLKALLKLIKCGYKGTHNTMYVHAGSSTSNAQISAGRDISDDGGLHTEAHSLGWI